jgi:single-strand DNA-binding protein
MPGLNRVELIGRLGKDPETRFTPSGKKVCTFSLAVDRHWKSSTGEAKSDTDWFNIEAWGRQGEICQQYLKKGSLVYLEGRLHTNKVEQNNETRYFTRVILARMQMLGTQKTKVEEPILPEAEEEPPVDEI